MLKTQEAITITEHTFQGTASTVFISRLVYTMRQEYQSSKQKEKKKVLNINGSSVNFFFVCLVWGFVWFVCFGILFVCFQVLFACFRVLFVCLPQLICSSKVTYLKKKK